MLRGIFLTFSSAREVSLVNALSAKKEYCLLLLTDTEGKMRRMAVAFLVCFVGVDLLGDRRIREISSSLEPPEVVSSDGGMTREGTPDLAPYPELWKLVDGGLEPWATSPNELDSGPRISTDAEGCQISSTSCNRVSFGQLAVGDCTSEDGTYIDVHRFQGTRDRYVAATVRPLSSSYRKPNILMAAPPGDASRTPFVIGGTAATVWYRLSSSGEWRIGIGTEDLFSSGPYALELFCSTGPTDGPQNCVYQDILCNQTQAWFLTSQSCRFASGERVYQGHEIYGVQGDVIYIEMASNDFQPLFAVYNEDVKLLDSSSPQGNAGAVMTFHVPSTGFYTVAATSRLERSTGFYFVRVSCARSGCLNPLIIRDQEDIEVALGQRATITLDVHAVGSVNYSWLDVTDFPLSAGSTSTPTFVTEPITRTRYFRVRAENACGWDESRMIKVSAKSTAGRRRSARH
jgi:hypothetical protein